MSVRTLEVSPEDAGSRLDRWFKRHFPEVPHGRLEKLLRTGQVRVDGARVKANLRLEAGQSVRVPPLGERARAPESRPVPPQNEADVAALRDSILHKDDSVIVVNKPPGLAVQGGSKTSRHIDGMLDGLRFGAPERPRLVHRLDKDTSGVLVLARSAVAARALAAAFKHKDAKKLYWALVAGRPEPPSGRIDQALAKRGGAGGEKVVGADEGKPAVTLYRTIESAGGESTGGESAGRAHAEGESVGRHLSWLALTPLSGRTHQLRAHCALHGVPVLGDGKYGGKQAFPGGAGIAKGLHLHARAIELPHPDGGVLRAQAPLPPHMAEAFAALGFDPEREGEGG